jgi:hypothetical protein
MEMTEKIFIQRVNVRVIDLQYVDRGPDFVRIRAEDGELYDIKVEKTKIRKSKPKKFKI